MNSIQVNISVALTTCNGAKYLEGQLESIGNQTHKPYELVVGDDASTDDTLIVLEKFAEQANFPVRIFKNEPRLGVLKNFIHVFNQCQGNFIAYCDQDDVWALDKLEKCCTALIKHDAVLVLHHSQVVDEQLQPTGQILPFGFPLGDYKAPHYPFIYWGHGHQMVFRKKLVGAINYFQQVAQNDLHRFQNNLDLLINSVAGMYGTSVFIPDQLIQFRRHSQTVSACAKKNKEKTNYKSKRLKKQNELEELVKTLNALHNYLTTIEHKGNITIAEHYIRFINDKKQAMRNRVQIYNGKNFIQRLVGIGNACIHRVYVAPKNGGVGLRQFAIDFIALI